MNRAEIRAMLAGLPKLPPADRLLLTVLALHADNDGRCWPGKELLEAETGLRRGLDDAFERLARAGLEVRVPVTPGATGRGRFTFPGNKRQFLLPKELLVRASADVDAAGQRGRSGQDRTNQPRPARTSKPAGQAAMVRSGPERMVRSEPDQMVRSEPDPKSEQQKLEKQKSTGACAAPDPTGSSQPTNRAGMTALNAHTRDQDRNAGTREPGQAEGANGKDQLRAAQLRVAAQAIDGPRAADGYTTARLAYLAAELIGTRPVRDPVAYLTKILTDYGGLDGAAGKLGAP